MNTRVVFVFLAHILFTPSLPIEAADPQPISNITVIGAVFCDACSDNFFSRHSYFLQGAKVLVECKFRANSTSKEEISITADRTTDRFGMYELNIPPVDGFECREGREIESFCRASLTGSSSPLCSAPGLASSTEHVAVKCKAANLCVFNLNALNYRPAKRDAALCGASREQLSAASFNTSLFFWPPFPPFGFPWPFPFPFPFPTTTPPTLPFPFPPIPFFNPPPSLPFPFPPWFPFPQPPSLPFPFSPAGPNPPALQLPPFPPLTQIPPPSPSFPWPFPPFPPSIPAPGLPSPLPPTFSLRDPRTWFPFNPPSSSPGQPEDQKQP